MNRGGVEGWWKDESVGGLQTDGSGQEEDMTGREEIFLSPSAPHLSRCVSSCSC